MWAIPGWKAVWWIPAAFILAIAALVFTGPSANGSGSRPQAKVVPQLKIVGNGAGGPKLQMINAQGQVLHRASCSLASGASFRFRVVGARPGNWVMIVVKYQSGEFYWYHTNFGVYKVGPSGTVTAKKPWDCLDGPGSTTDPPGKYGAAVIDLGAVKPQKHFDVTR